MWDSLQNGTPSPRTEVLLNIDPYFWKNAALRVGDWKIVEGEGPDLGYWYPIPIDPSWELSVNCSGLPPSEPTFCDEEHGACLFNIKDDPCEFKDMSKTEPQVFQRLKNRLEEYRKSMVPPRNNMTIDPLSNPKLHNGVWTSWREPLEKISMIL